MHHAAYNLLPMLIDEKGSTLLRDDILLFDKVPGFELTLIIRDESLYGCSDLNPR